MPLRISSREAKLQQMQQQQQLDIQQQQADAQQQAAMLGAISQLYNLNNSQQMQPLQMQSAQLANDRASMDLAHMPNIYDLQQRTGESGLQSAEQARMLNVNADARAQAGEGRAAAMHDPMLRSAVAQAGGQEFQTQNMPNVYDLQQRTGESALTTAAANRMLAGSEEQRRQAMHPLELLHAGLGNNLLQSNVDTSNLQLGALPEQLAQGLAAGALSNDLLRTKAAWANPFAEQEYRANDANLAHSKAQTSVLMNQGAPFSAMDQAAVWDPTDNPVTRIPEQMKASVDAQVAKLAAMGMDANGQPLTVPAIGNQQDTITSYLGHNFGKLYHDVSGAISPIEILKKLNQIQPQQSTNKKTKKSEYQSAFNLY